MVTRRNFLGQAAALAIPAMPNVATLELSTAASPTSVATSALKAAFSNIFPSITSSLRTSSQSFSGGIGGKDDSFPRTISSIFSRLGLMVKIQPDKPQNVLTAIIGKTAGAIRTESTRYLEHVKVTYPDDKHRIRAAGCLKNAIYEAFKALGDNHVITYDDVRIIAKHINFAQTIIEDRWLAKMKGSLAAASSQVPLEFRQFLDGDYNIKPPSKIDIVSYAKDDSTQVFREHRYRIELKRNPRESEQDHKTRTEDFGNFLMYMFPKEIKLPHQGNLRAGIQYIELTWTGNSALKKILDLWVGNQPQMSR